MLKLTEVKLFLLVAGTLQIAVAQLTCRGGQSCSGPFCPNTIVQYMCNISAPLTFTRWTIPVQQCGGINTTFLRLPQTVQSSCGISSLQCGSFQASNIPPVGNSPCTSSILSVNITSDLNGTLITCYNSDTNTQYLIGSATILVLSVPGAPNLSVTAKLNELLLGCSYGDEAVQCNVTIEINGTAVVSIAANGTFYGLVSNTLYPISARAINRCGDYSETNTSHWTLPEAPPTATIKVLQSLFNQSASQLNISWIHVGGNVSQYILKSVSGMNMFILEASVQGSCVGVSCMYRQIVQTTGSYYTVTISSVNDGGVGPESDPVQGELASSLNPSFAVAIGVGVGIPLLLIVICATSAIVFVAYHIKKSTGRTLNKEAKHDRSELIEVNTLESSPKSNRAKKEGTLQKDVNEISSSPKDTELGSCEGSSGGQLNTSENKASVQNASDKTAEVLPGQNGMVPPPKPSEANNEVGNKRAKHEGTLQKDVSCSPKDTELTCRSYEGFEVIDRISDCSSGGQISASENKVLVQNTSDKIAEVLPGQNGILPLPYKQPRATENEVVNKQQVLHKRAPQYIRNPLNGTVLTICDDVLMFKYPSYVPDDTQLWYLDDQPDGSFMIVSKMNRKVLACDSESEIQISIQERRGAEGQKWLFEETRIVSLKHHTVMCLRKPEMCLIHVRLKKMTHFNELCCLQPAPMVPMYIHVSDDKNGSVLEIKDDEGLISNDAVMDSTNYNQHWYMYILQHHHNEAEEVFVIASWNGQKALQWDGQVLMVKPYDHKDEAQQWTMNGEFFIVPKKNKHSMKLKAHTVFRSYFLIKYVSSYLTCDHIRKKVILSNIEDRTMPLEKHLWMLDMQPDETFKVISCVNKLELQCDEDNRLLLSSSNSDGYQLWRKEGNNIISEKSHGYVGIDDHDNTLLSIHCKVTGDVWRQKHTCEIHKVLVNASQIIHQDTGFVLTAPTASSSTEEAKEGSEVTLSPINGLPHHTQHWLLDHKIDGTFVIISDSINRLVITCDHSAGLPTKLIMSRFTGEDSQLWRFDRNYIESVMFEGHVISCTSNSQCDLTLCAKGLSNISQYFNNKPMMPVYIRNLQNGSVLELTEEEVECKPLDGPRSEYQQWYIKYVKGHGDATFMIISKKNGKALQKSGDKVKTSECNDQHISQLWRRDGLYILPQEQDILFFLKVVSVKNNSTHLVFRNEGPPLTYKPEEWISCFEIQHITAESYL